MEETRPAPGSRLYRSEADLVAMQGLLMAGRAETNDWRYPHTGDLMWNFFLVLAHQDPRECVRLWHDADGRLVAYAILGEDPSFDCQVLPEAAGAGLEAAALAWVDAELARAGSQGELVSVVRKDDARRIAFLRAHRFRYYGKFPEVNLLCPLDRPLPEPEVPPGFTLRAVAEGEAAARAQAEHDVWAPWPVGDISGEDYARLMQLPGYERELDLVGVAGAAGGAIASYANCWIDPVNRVGDFGPVGALPAYRRMGLTRAVLLEGLRRMQARGMNRALVSTTVTNEPARRLYESLGFRVVNETLDYVREGRIDLAGRDTAVRSPQRS